MNKIMNMKGKYYYHPVLQMKKWGLENLNNIPEVPQQIRHNPRVLTLNIYDWVPLSKLIICVKSYSPTATWVLIDFLKGCGCKKIIRCRALLLLEYNLSPWVSHSRPQLCLLILHAESFGIGASITRKGLWRQPSLICSCLWCILFRVWKTGF
jgi:hypothetical protein